MQFHLTHHLCPSRKSDLWRWHLRQLADRFRIFNGKRILSIASDANTFSLREVLNYSQSLGLEWTAHQQVRNLRRMGEHQSWSGLMRLLEPQHLGVDDAVFYCHSKGVTHPGNEAPTIWSSVMYEAALDYIPVVIDHFRRDYAFTGSIKGTREKFFGGPDVDWCYAGTFFWWKPSIVGDKHRQVKPRYHGLEMWPGESFPFEKCGDLFTPPGLGVDDGCVQGAPYSVDIWRNIYLPQFDEWKRANAHFRSTL